MNRRPLSAPNRKVSAPTMHKRGTSKLIVKARALSRRRAHRTLRGNWLLVEPERTAHMHRHVHARTRTVAVFGQCGVAGAHGVA